MQQERWNAYCSLFCFFPFFSLLVLFSVMIFCYLQISELRFGITDLKFLSLYYFSPGIMCVCVIYLLLLFFEDWNCPVNLVKFLCVQDEIFVPNCMYWCSTPHTTVICQSLHVGCVQNAGIREYSSLLLTQVYPFQIKDPLI